MEICINKLSFSPIIITHNWRNEYNGGIFLQIYIMKVIVHHVQLYNQDCVFLV